MRRRIYIFAAVLMLLYAAASMHLIKIINDSRVITAASQSGTYTVKKITNYGYIYDRNMIPLVNRSDISYALIDPGSCDLTKTFSHILDKERFRSGMSGYIPFLCRVDNTYPEDESNPVIKVKQRYSDDQPALHVIGYTSGGKGVCGIEGAYDDLLRTSTSEESMTFSVNALGDTLDGIAARTVKTEENTAGVVTTLDTDIQRICERAMSGIQCGAAVIMDVTSGDILAAVSRPCYDINYIEASLNDSTAPFVNRAFSAYSTGSVFKLVIAAAALEGGISEDYTYNCRGYTDICGKRFNCHLWSGHGKLDMRQAMIESCNPYFISLGRNIPNDRLIAFIKCCGFGESSDLGGLISSDGNVPDISDIAIPAEKANLCFGQGMLTATPVQVCRFICAAANGGEMPQPCLVSGITSGMNDIPKRKTNSKTIFSVKTSEKLRSFMHDTLMKESSLGIPSHTTGGGKTSTAQTGTFHENGSEKLDCWFAGFFPFERPRYAVVIIAEDGVSGNVSCAPIFREIADNVTLLGR